MDLRLAQLLCARVCHDLIGAAGAIETGVELLAEDSADQADIFDLIGLSGRQLNRRLAFYRLAFGMSGRAGDGRPASEVRRLVEGFLDGGRVTLRWEIGSAGADADRLGGQETRMLLCAVLVAAEGLPRGGELTVRLAGAGTTLAVEARGKNGAVPDPIAAALAEGADLDAVTARTVPAYYLRMQSRSFAMDLDLRQEDGGFILGIATSPR
ncbi:MAG: histidine phosphotransferase family protein [Rhodospirillales bacterium]|jgi:histidine phosphotransferase ChpT|nr:histidine phosphotransferase family protein [Rhodospirillales bacterium]